MPSTPSVTNTAAPTITGVAQVASTLTATTGAWDPTTDLTFAYRWLLDGAPVAGATDPTYVPTASDLGHTLRVEVTASRDGYTSATATSVATEPVAAAPVPAITSSEAPTIAGKARVGSTLTATTGAWDPTTDLTYAYRWLLDGAPVAGATDSTYTVAPSDRGRTLTVEVTASRDGYTSATETSTATDVVDKGVLESIEKPRVSGKVKRACRPQGLDGHLVTGTGRGQLPMVRGRQDDPPGPRPQAPAHGQDRTPREGQADHGPRHGLGPRLHHGDREDQVPRQARAAARPSRSHHCSTWAPGQAPRCCPPDEQCRTQRSRNAQVGRVRAMITPRSCSLRSHLRGDPE